jgi:DNA topoisomerase II
VPVSNLPTLLSFRGSIVALNDVISAFSRFLLPSLESLAMSGLSVVGRDNYGVFPLRGKPLNVRLRHQQRPWTERFPSQFGVSNLSPSSSSQVRDATHQAIMKNEEIKALVDILGLKFGTTYDDKNIKQLRYGHLMIMADQDHDG